MTELDKTGLEAALNTWREATAWGCEPDEAFPSAISAYLEAANTSAGVTEAQTPRVKQLEWRELYEGRFFPKDWHGTGILSARYVVAQHWKDGGFYVLGKEFDTLDAAKAAAQHEYETLVQSALEASRVDAKGAKA